MHKAQKAKAKDLSFVLKMELKSFYIKDDNPFENNGFLSFEDKTVEVEGDLVNGVFEVTSVKEYVAEEKNSGGEE